MLGTVKMVKRIHLGELHMIVSCVDQASDKIKVYGMGKNTWGQLGINPFDTQFVPNLEREIFIQALGNQTSYEYINIDCGSFHSVFLAEKNQTGERIIVQLGNDQAKITDKNICNLNNKSGIPRDEAIGVRSKINLKLEKCYKGDIKKLRATRQNEA